MKKHDPVHTYIGKVSRLLYCSKEEKQARLQGLEQSLLEAADLQSFASLSDVIAAFGSPEEMAEELSESLPLEDELFQHTRLCSKLRITIACLAVVALFLLIAVLYLVAYYSPPMIYLSASAFCLFTPEEESYEWLP